MISDESSGFLGRYALLLRRAASDLGRFDGREGRTSYWRLFTMLFALLYVGLFIAFALSATIVEVGGQTEAAGAGVFASVGGFLVVLWVAVLASPTAKRLRDAGRSPWWGLCILPSLVAAQISNVQFALEADIGETYSWYYGVEFSAMLSFVLAVGILLWKLTRPSIGGSEVGVIPH